MKEGGTYICLDRVVTLAASPSGFNSTSKGYNKQKNKANDTLNFFSSIYFFHHSWKKAFSTMIFFNAKLFWYSQQMMYFLCILSSFLVYLDTLEHWYISSRSYRLQWWSCWAGWAEQSLIFEQPHYFIYNYIYFFKKNLDVFAKFDSVCFFVILS